MPAPSFALLFQGDSIAAPGVVFGDCVRCVGGSLVRIALLAAPSGAVVHPGPGAPSLSTSGGVGPGSGSRYYQFWYRDQAAFCLPQTFNASSGLQLIW